VSRFDFIGVVDELCIGINVIIIIIIVDERR
jgi:hypothetical protein